MPWRPITEVDQLAGQHERASFDAKEKYPDGAGDEIGKDVAAFANGIGGTVLVGAIEQAGKLVAFRSVDPKRLQERVAKAVQKCRPTPTYHERVLTIRPEDHQRITGRSTEETFQVLAINVQPFLLAPIAVPHPTEQGYWRFPLRVGDQTELLQPDEVALRMDAHDRKIYLRLRAILQDPELQRARTGYEGVRVVVYQRSKAEGSAGEAYDLADLDEVDLLAVFRVSDGKARVPLAFIREVWRDTELGWSLALDGMLFRTPPNSRTRVPFLPGRT